MYLCILFCLRLRRLAKASFRTWKLIRLLTKQKLLEFLITSEIIKLECLLHTTSIFSRCLFSSFSVVKVFKNGPSKICGKQPLKNLKWYGQPKQLLLFSLYLTVSKGITIHNIFNDLHYLITLWYVQ